MPASFEMEALKAQCVAARTFVTKRGFEVDDTTRTQVYHDDKQMRQIWGVPMIRCMPGLLRRCRRQKGKS